MDVEVYYKFSILKTYFISICLLILYLISPYNIALIKKPNKKKDHSNNILIF
jgi:hypothetical protein